MGVGNGRVEVDGRPIYTAKDLKVGLFTDTTTFQSSIKRKTPTAIAVGVVF